MTRLSIPAALLLITTVGCGDETSNQGGDTPDDTGVEDTSLPVPTCDDIDSDWDVPHDWGYIRYAVEAAESGQTICIEPGTYNDTIDLAGKDLTIIGIGGSQQTIVDAQQNGSVVLIEHGETAHIQGLTLRNGERSTEGAGIAMDDAVVSLQDLRIEANTTAGDGGGIYAEGCSGSWTDIALSSNVAKGTGGGIKLLDCDGLTITGAIIQDNYVEGGGGGIHVSQSTDITLDSCEITDNEADQGGGGGVFLYRSENVVIQDTTITGNHCDQDGGGLHVYSSTYSLEGSTSIEGNSPDDIYIDS